MNQQQPFAAYPSNTLPSLQSAPQPQAVTLNDLVSLKEGSPSRMEAGPVRVQPTPMARMVWPSLQYCRRSVLKR